MPAALHRPRVLDLGLIKLRVNGFGQISHYRDRAGFDLVAEAMSGFRTLLASPEDPRCAWVSRSAPLVGEHDHEVLGSALAAAADQSMERGVQ